mmetsp:Transcript_80058/g.235483  ORF Transcript_80058/g.235483 Transcript_80058/m.235483 type:complete len:426 (+) Transcript_80058:45-1322(+)
MSQHRISVEAELLKAVSDDDAEGVRRVLGANAPAAQLLRLRVKPTFNNARDESAFFHSVASFGLTYALGDSVVDLAERNGCVEASQVLREAASAEVVVGAESRAAAEAALLSAIAADDVQALQSALSGTVPASHLVRLTVKERFHDLSDNAAFFHSVAAHGLKFELGDTAEQLAHRNGHRKVAAALKRYSMPLLQCQLSSPAPEDLQASPSNLHVVVSNAASGNLVAEIAACTSWTLGMLQGAMERPTSGCWRFISDGSPLTPGICLADLCRDDGGTLQLSAICVPVVTGAYHASCLSSGFRRHRHRGQIHLRLQDDGSLVLELETTTDGPLPCANRPPALIFAKFTFQGTWSSEQPGVVAAFGDGYEVEHEQEHRTHIMLDGKLKMILVQEGQLEVVDSTQEGVRRCLPGEFCSVGTVFLRSLD